LSVVPSIALVIFFFASCRTNVPVSDIQYVMILKIQYDCVVPQAFLER
jgi:hypothetical protein